MNIDQKQLSKYVYYFRDEISKNQYQNFFMTEVNARSMSFDLFSNKSRYSLVASLFCWKKIVLKWRKLKSFELKKNCHFEIKSIDRNENQFFIDRINSFFYVFLYSVAREYFIQKNFIFLNLFSFRLIL